MNPAREEGDLPREPARQNGQAGENGKASENGQKVSNGQNSLGTQNGDWLGHAGDDAAFEDVSLREIALVPFKRRRTVLGLALAGLIAGILVTVTMTPRYRATATIELNEEKNGGVSALSDLAAVATGSGDELKVKIQTETAVIEDASIALAVMGKLGMLRASGSGWFGSGGSEPDSRATVSADALSPRRRDELVQGFEANLQVREVDNSRLIAITYSSVDPVMAAKVANQIVAEYRAYLLQSNYSSSQEVSGWLAGQLSGLADQVTRSQASVAEFERSHHLSAALPGLAMLGEGGPKSAGGSGGSGGMRIPELDRLASLNEAVTQAEARRLTSGDSGARRAVFLA